MEKSSQAQIIAARTKKILALHASGLTGIASHAFSVSSAYRPPYCTVPNSVSFSIVSPVLVFRKTENGRGKFRGERIVIRESRKPPERPDRGSAAQGPGVPAGMA